MWTSIEMDKYIKEKLKPKRYTHSLGVSQTSRKLAEMYGGDVDKAYIAGLIHDCAKNMKDEELINIVENNGYTIDIVSRKSPQLLHGPAGAIIAQKNMGVTDIDVLNAIWYHTTGRENMSILEKIVYLADCIEPGREFDGIEKLREAARKDLDSAVLLSLDYGINYVIEKGELIHLDSVSARNYLLIHKNINI